MSDFGEHLTESVDNKKLQLQMGMKVEREHHDLWLKIKDYVDGVMTEREFYSMIAKAHYRENKKYYTILKEAGL